MPEPDYDMLQIGSTIINHGRTKYANYSYSGLTFDDPAYYQTSKGLISPRFGPFRFIVLGRWQKYGVDNVDYAVAAGDVGLGDVHVAIECYTTVGGYLQIGAVDRLRCFAV